MIDTFFLESKIWYDGHESFNNNLSFLADLPHELLELMFEPRHLPKHTCPYVKKVKLKKKLSGIDVNLNGYQFAINA